jgi:hypothetical protein
MRKSDTFRKSRNYLRNFADTTTIHDRTRQTQKMENDAPELGLYLSRYQCALLLPLSDHTKPSPTA